MDQVEKIQGTTQPDRTQTIVTMETTRRFSEAQAQRVELKRLGEASRRVVEGGDRSSRSQVRGNGEFAEHVSRTYAQFEVNSETHEVSVRIVDRETGEVVRTIPPDELARLVSNHDMYRGLLLEWKL